MINRKIINSSLPIILTLCFLVCYTPLSHSADAYLVIGTGSGSPGSQGAITVSLENSMDKVTGAQMEICVEGGHLSCTRCDTIGRTTEDFICMSNALINGCCRVILSSFVRGVIEEGKGPIFIVDYKIGEKAPSGQCININTQKVTVTGEKINNIDFKKLKVVEVPGEFCFTGGSEDETSTTTSTKTPITTTITPSTKTTTIKTTPDIRVTTIPTTTIPAIPDTTVTTTPRTLAIPRIPVATNTTTIREPTTKTKESPERTTEIPSKTTTIPLSSPYQLLISPLSATLNSGMVVEFRANTIAEGKKVKGAYEWEITPASTIGSTINENGLFAAGNNTSDYTIKEIVRVTDTFHENSEATVTVTINVQKSSPTGCELSISPSSATLFPGDTITFSAKNSGERCAESSYNWKILSKIDSRISENGIYTAGNNRNGDSAFDIIVAKDNNNNISTDAMVTVLSREKGTQVAPDSTQKPQQETFSGSGSYLKILIIIFVLIILTGIVLFWKIRR